MTLLRKETPSMNDNNTLADDLGERIRELESELAKIRSERLEWAMVCHCMCASCKRLDVVIRGEPK